MSEKEFTKITYPTVYSDIPDLDITRRGDTFYMVSTTMNLCPGVPIMKSADLAHWQIVNYVYDILENDNRSGLENGEQIYSKGSWAASLKYDEATKLYYVAFNSNGKGFYTYTTDDIEKGKWKRHATSNFYHDPALFIEDGHIYVISAAGNECRIQELRLNDEAETVETIGNLQTLFTKPSGWGLWEGAHAYHIGDYYYIFVIASPADRWMRTELCYRTSDLLSGKWEEMIVYQGPSGGEGAGLAQGGIVDTKSGDWYGFLFQDRGGIGRVPSIIDVNWQNNWPMLGTFTEDGQFMQSQSEGVGTIRLQEDKNGNRFISCDEFEYEKTSDLNLCWQWNHNPKLEYVSFTERPGFFRLTTDKPVDNIWFAHNSLTQRTVNRDCMAEISLYTDNMKSGDFAGLATIADHGAMIGVFCGENGERRLFQGNSQFLQGNTINEIADEPLKEGQEVRLRAIYKTWEITFEYSLDGEVYKKLGTTFTPGFATNTTFMGCRFWLFNYATKEAGGFADFDYYHVIA